MAIPSRFIASGRTAFAALTGLAALSVGACATQDVYDPVPKFAQFEAPDEEIALTGSRIARYESSVEQSRNALSPTSIITQQDFARYGETNLYRMLLRQMPNMVGPGYGLRSTSPQPARPGGGR